MCRRTHAKNGFSTECKMTCKECRDFSHEIKFVDRSRSAKSTFYTCPKCHCVLSNWNKSCYVQCVVVCTSWRVRQIIKPHSYKFVVEGLKISESRFQHSLLQVCPQTYHYQVCSINIWFAVPIKFYFNLHLCW